MGLLSWKIEHVRHHRRFYWTSLPQRRAAGVQTGSGSVWAVGWHGDEHRHPWLPQGTGEWCISYHWPRSCDRGMACEIELHWLHLKLLCVSSDAVFTLRTMNCYSPAAAAKSLQSCPTLCNPIDGLLPGSPIPGILQARTLEWVAISFSNAWKWKVKVKLLSCVRLLATSWTIAHQAPPSMGFSRQQCWSGVPSPSPRALHSSLGSSHLPKCMHFFQFLLLAGLNERLWKASVKYWYKHKPELACVTSIIGATLECKFANKKPINIRCG